MTAPDPVAPLGVAVVGCGSISDQYLTNLTSFPEVSVLFCADLDVDRAAAQAARYGVPASGTFGQALEHPGVELVVNLTVPAAHVEVASAALEAGLHVWNEKPLTLDLEDGRALVAQAGRVGRRLGCAPDTVLGTGFQAARRLIDAGAIGTPLTALALVQEPGPDRWHPNPAFLFQRGAGPLFDLGPYYLTVLASLFGPAHRVGAVGRQALTTRRIVAGDRAGTEFRVEVPTHVSALVEYAGGPAATLLFSFDSPLRRHGFVEVTGTEATLALPDPNHFAGEVRIRDRGDEEWRVAAPPVPSAGRGLGVVDMVRSLRAGTPHRASGELGLHVLELMTAIERSAAAGEFDTVRGSFPMPEPLPPGWAPGTATGS
ncbi:gfo/Idh/MocA family oxidoreductase [Actinoalloteichus sp. AHMU CJ021]|uniref:Dehydrogenase n=1 Tax=Actinoalloteichus caeruleus DSM 43889 TaxID=1120930 RepID=A0ABT1JH24_ACTCY|nr:Gfo/Idh/MocA family oxidoreductase [Actinoalloteichus caeruleus]AUS77279.1 gfo/Idh/MocA family oxidoreductase [Actinoalloteichus sp. AHMU CJ021]MCP2331076.1 putative dehydrogenase [Actinoalloteichus caeruleus DSM 43889]